ncbi:MAG: putative membrane protein [Arenicella sp.]|jgi:uncharacterized membrane protein
MKISIQAWTDLSCLILFLSVWFGYARYSRRMISKRNSLAGMMKKQRVAWMQNCMVRSSHIDDAALIANVDRHVTFYASTTLLILAGLVTSLSQVVPIQKMLLSLPFSYALETSQIQLRLMALIAIYIYAYFTISWSLRQLSFASVMLGAGQVQSGNQLHATDANMVFAGLVAEVIDLSAHSFNSGLRAYYFSMATVSWFYHPAVFVLSCLVVAIVLYRREFKSGTLAVLTEANKTLPQ